MKVSIPATCGTPYVVERRGNYYKLIRKTPGHKHTIIMAKDDAIAVTNQLIDLIEENNNE